MGQQLSEDLERILIDLDPLERRLTSMLQEALPVDTTQANDMVVKYKVSSQL